MPKLYALVCFDDGDARVFDYIKAEDEVVDLVMEWRLRATHMEVSPNKKLLSVKAKLARSDEFANTVIYHPAP